MKNYQGFIVAIKTNFDKYIAYYVPDKFEEAKDGKDTEKLLGFYWINGDQLITVTNSIAPWFSSNDRYFIGIKGIWIENDRN